MKINLKGMSEKELQKLKDDVDKALADLGSKKRADALKAAEAAAQKFGFSLAEIAPASKKGRGRATTSGKPKYRNPDDSQKTWSGRGRQPAWIKAHLAAGNSLQELEI